jgi:glyoxylase-like metal-dependent hydrolase (beta-lactamase superfamily II)
MRDHENNMPRDGINSKIWSYMAYLKRNGKMSIKNEEWFEVKRVSANIYRISENKHWEKTNCYLLTGRDSAVLIDSGTGIGNIRDITDSLTDLPVTVITTHAHWDHIGNHSRFDGFFVHEDDRAWMENGSGYPAKNILVRNVNPKHLPADFNIEKYRVFTGKATTVLVDDDRIILPDWDLRVIHTPGHSPGHICLYDEVNNYLFTGDTVYEGKIFINFDSTDPVKYKQSIEKLLTINNYQNLKIFPGHKQSESRRLYLGYDS